MHLRDSAFGISSHAEEWRTSGTVCDDYTDDDGDADDGRLKRRVDDDGDHDAENVFKDDDDDDGDGDDNDDDDDDDDDADDDDA